MPIRPLARALNVSPITITSLLRSAGRGSVAFHDMHVRDVAARRVQADEVWSFVYVKQKNPSEAKALPGGGDVWT